MKASYLNTQTVHPERLLTIPGEARAAPSAEGDSVLFLSEAPAGLWCSNASGLQLSAGAWCWEGGNALLDTLF